MCEFNLPAAQPSLEDADLPTVVIELRGGLISLVRSDRPVHVVILDEDTEGGDPENISTVNGEEVYVIEHLLTSPADSGSDGIKSEYVQGVLQHIWQGRA